MMNDGFIFVYCNSLGTSSIQNLVNIKVKEDGEGYIQYLQGWCELTQRVTTLRGDRIVEECDTIEEAEAIKADFDLNPEEYGFTEPKETFHVSRPDTFDICFTGFKKGDREELTEMAKKNNANVHVSVVKYLDMLCYGANAGPMKLKKAMSQGAIIANRMQFENFITTGEIPEDV